MGPFSRPYIVQMTYDKLHNVFGKLSAILTRALKSTTHLWLRVVHVGISVIFNVTCHTQEVELHCYTFVTLKLHLNSHCKRYAETRFELQKDFGHAAFTQVQVQRDVAHRRLVEKVVMCKK